MIRWCVLVAFHAIQLESDLGLATFGSRCPVAFGPGWIVSHMLKMSAVQLGDPMVLFIFVIADDGLFHNQETLNRIGNLL